MPRIPPHPAPPLSTPPPSTIRRGDRPVGRRAVVATTALALAIAASCAGPEDAAAQDLHGWIDAGWALPSDPPEFWQLWDGGWTLGGGLGVRAAPEWSFGATLHVDRFQPDRPAMVDDLLLSDGTTILPVASIDGRDLTTTTMAAFARFHFSPPSARFDPFLHFGWGYFRLEENDASVTPDRPGADPILVLGRTENAFGTAVGGGMTWAVAPRVRIQFSAIYTVGFAEPTSAQFLPFRLGIGIR